MAHKAKNIFATLTLADFYHYGFGDLQKNSTKASNYYTKVIQSGTENSFYVSHAYFNLGQMVQYGDGLDKNTTKAIRYYNHSTIHEPNAFYPSLLMKYAIYYESSSFSNIVYNLFSSVLSSLTTPGYVLYSLTAFVILYTIFFISLVIQKD